MKYSIAALVLCLSIFSTTARALPLDVTFLVDSSGSITPDDYETLMEYTRDLIGAIRDGNVDTTFALVEFSTAAVIRQAHEQDINALNAVIDASYQYGGQTNWTGAFDTAMNVINGSGRVAAQQAAILITDGVHNVGSIFAAFESANELLDEGVLLFGVGYDGNIARSDLEDLVSSPSDNFAFHADDADSLVSTIPAIVGELNAFAPPVNVPAPAGLFLLLAGLRWCPWCH